MAQRLREMEERLRGQASLINTASSIDDTPSPGFPSAGASGDSAAGNGDGVAAASSEGSSGASSNGTYAPVSSRQSARCSVPALTCLLLLGRAMPHDWPLTC